jgi:enolase
LEDPFHEDDFNSFAKIKEKLKNVLVCGDDLLVTNINRLKIAIKNNSINAAIVKPNQIGTITDTIKFVKEAKKNNIATIMSHRSGETEDSLICHLAVGLNCDYVKFGISGERVIKINEMIRIEEKIQ